MDRHSEEMHVSGVGGVDIFFRHYPADDERARLIIAHGLGEHSGRYTPVIEAVGARCDVWMPDHRGHGRSGGPRGHIARFEEYLADLDLVIGRARETLPAGGRLFLMGHSLGGLIALRHAQTRPGMFDGLIVSSPALGIRTHVPGWKKVLGQWMSSIKPDLGMKSGLDANDLSHDARVVKAYVDDPLVHDLVTARYFTEFMAAIAAAHADAAKITVPLLLQVAGGDRIVDPAAAEAFFQRVAARDKTFHAYPDCFHEIYNETPDRSTVVLGHLADWLDARLK